jgi:RNA polymerase sigma-70 factor (ECF subfamily)
MYRQYEQRLLGYALRRAPVEVAKDAVAETFLAAWRRFDELPEDPLPWLVQATRKTLANQRRSSARQLRLAERLAREAAAEPRPSVGGMLGDGPVRAALNRLGADDREALALVAWDGLTPAQAAHSLGCTPVAFRVRLHRARRRFERALADVDEAESRRHTPARPAPTLNEVP